MKSFKNLMILGFGLLMLGAMMTSCSDNTDELSLDDTTVENFVDRSVFGFQGVGKIGKMGCYEFVFPIDITIGDDGTQSIADYEELRLAIAQAIVDNQDTTGVRPMLVYPIEVTDSEGEIIVVESVEDMKTLRRECRKDFLDRVRNRGHRKGDRCFKLVFPVEIAFPDETTVAVEDRMAFKTAVRTWKADNPEAEERPELVFPVTVEFKDDSVATIESKEGFARIREACSED